jgi:hypothetical protein
MTPPSAANAQLDRAARHSGIAVPVGLALLAAVGVLLVVADVQSPIRAVVVGLFVLVAPGWAVLDHWGLVRGWIGAALVVATSISLTTGLLLVQLYAGVWSPRIGLTLLILLILVVELVEVGQRLYRAVGGAR